MNFIVLFSLIISSLVLLLVLVPLLRLVFWATNRWLLKGRFKLVYRILLSICLPFLLICFIFIYTYYAPYSTSDMNKRLECLIPEIKLPPYTITKYSSRYLEGDDLKDTYQMVFKNGKDLALKRTLDSLITANPKWKNINNEYVYDTIFEGTEIIDSIIIRPLNGTATFIYYKW